MEKHERTGWIVGLVLGLIICAGIFYLGNLMTVNPAQTSGNGNPMLLALPFLCLVGGIIARGWMAVIMKWSKKLLWSGFWIIPILLYVAYRYQAKEFDRYGTYVKNIVMDDEWRADLDYVDSITDVSSIYMNNQLYNVNTFVMFAGLTLWVGIILMLSVRYTSIQSKRSH